MSALLAWLALTRRAPPTDSADPEHRILRRGRNYQLEWQPGQAAAALSWPQGSTAR
jgi:hypothetical protein